MFKKTFNISFANQLRLVSQNRAKCANETSTVSNQNYYRNIGESQLLEEASRPAGWDEALPFENIPGPKPLPVVGNYLKFLPVIGKYAGIDYTIFLQRLQQEYGDVVALRKLDGKKSHVFLYDPNDIEMIFRNEGFWPFREIIPGTEYYRRFLRKDVFDGAVGVAIGNGKEWFDMRTVVNPILMQPRSSELYVGQIDKVAAQFVDNMRYFMKKSSSNEMPTDFFNELNKFSLEAICTIALDKRLGCLDRNLKPGSEVQQFIDYVVEFFELAYRIEVLPSLWRYFSTPDWKRYVKVLNAITDFILKHTEEVKNAGAENVTDGELSILQRLLKVNKQIAIVTAVDLIQAGVDTTSKTVAATLYYLAKNKPAQDKLRQELIELLPTPKTPITKETLRSATYLKAVVKETQRLAPVSLVNYRQTIKDLVIKGYQVPKGTNIQTANYVISRSAKYFTKPLEYVPERWLRSTTDTELSYKNVNPFVSLPFGFGPRSCVGKRLANMEVETIVAKITRNFQLNWPHEDIQFKTTIVHGVSGELKLHIQEITK